MNRARKETTIFRKIKERLLSLVYPRVCPVCGRILAHTESRENPYICKDCYPLLQWPEGARCLQCSRPLMDETQALCYDCQREQRWFDQGIALLLHDEVARKIIYDLKYSNKRDNADFAAFEAATRFSKLIRHWKPDVIIPIPLHPKKKQQRGFNQAELLAARLSYFLEEQGLSVPVDTSVLQRVRQTAVQKSLDKYQRMANIRGAFEVTYPQENPGQQKILPYGRILLVDDIYTSGATLSEAARVLKQAGAQKVWFFTVSIG